MGSLRTCRAYLMLGHLCLTGFICIVMTDRRMSFALFQRSVDLWPLAIVIGTRHPALLLQSAALPFHPFKKRCSLIAYIATV